MPNDLQFGGRLSGIFGQGDEARLRKILGKLDLSQLQGYTGTFGRPDLQRLINSNLFGTLGGGGKSFLQGLLSRAQGPQGTPGGGGGLIGVKRNVGGRILHHEGITDEEISRLEGLVSSGLFNDYMAGAQPFGVPDLLRALRRGQFGENQSFLESIGQRLGLTWQRPGGDPGGKPPGPPGPRPRPRPRNPYPDPDNNPGAGPHPQDGPGLPFTFGELTLDATPETGQINDLFDAILQRHTFEGLPGGVEQQLTDQLLGYLNTDAGSLTGGVSGDLLSQVEATLSQLMGGEGIPRDVLERVKNSVRGDAAARERNLLRRRGEQFAGRGLFGGGQQVRAMGEIERGITDELMGSLANIDYQDALAAERARQAGVQGGLQLQQIGSQREALANQIRQGGVSGLLNLGQQNLQELGLGSNELMESLRSAISREGLLTGRQLELMDLEMQRALQELMMNLQIKATEFGVNPEDTGGIPIEDILRGIPGFDRPGRFFDY